MSIVSIKSKILLPEAEVAEVALIKQQNDEHNVVTTDGKPHYLGHRARLKTRLLNSKPGTLPDYEILEILLFNSLPRQDTKTLAKELIKHFGTFAKVINAPEEKLRQFKKVGDSIISSFRIVHEAAALMVKEDITEDTIISSWERLIEYCRMAMGHRDTEQFRVLYLNKKNMLISDEIQDNGTVDQISIYPRELAKRAIYLNASAIILVHNHPTGDVKPSKADIDVTKLIIAALRPLGIGVHDHIIISSKSHFSFKTHALI